MTSPRGRAEDTGAADPVVRQLLVDLTGMAPAARQAAVLDLREARLLVPVVPSPEDPGEMVWVLTTGRDGRTGSLAFTGMDSLAAFDPQARPMPMSAREAARAALEVGAQALVIDVAGPRMLALEGEDLGLLSG